MQYHVLLQGEQRGPYTLRQIRAMWHAGDLTAPNLYWQEGMSGWLPLSSILHVLEPPEPAPPSPPADSPRLPPLADADPSTDAGSGRWLGVAVAFALGFGAALLARPLLPGGLASVPSRPTLSPVPAAAVALAPSPALSDDPPGFTGDADALARAYRVNEYAADRRYQGRPATVTGTIRDTGRDVLDSPFVVLGGEGPKEGVQCVFPRGDTVAAALTVGASVTIHGTVRGRTGRVLLGDCALQTPASPPIK